MFLYFNLTKNVSHKRTYGFHLEKRYFFENYYIVQKYGGGAVLIWRAKSAILICQTLEGAIAPPPLLTLASLMQIRKVISNCLKSVLCIEK